MKELQTALHALCEELGLEAPAPDQKGRYELKVGELVLRLAPWARDEVVLEGVISTMDKNAHNHWETQQEVLRQVLTWNIARLKGRARPEVLSYDEEENILLLWRTWPCSSRLSTNLLKGAEEMLSELEFWRGKLLALAPNLVRKN